MALSLQKYRGYLALMGDFVNNTAATAQGDLCGRSFKACDPTTYHITLATKDELRRIPQEMLDSIKLDTRHVFVLGVGGQQRVDVYWVVIVWAAGQQIRKQLGLQPKDFHITLTSNDIHDVDKGVESLLSTFNERGASVEVLDHIAFTYQVSGRYQEARQYAIAHIARSPDCEKGFLRFADATITLFEYKLAMLSYACTWTRTEDQKLRTYCLKKMIECSKETEWGHVLRSHEIAHIEEAKQVSAYLLRPWPQTLWDALSDKPLLPTLFLEPRDLLHIPSPKKAFYKLPRFFRWLVPGHLAIMSTPRNEDDIIALASPHIGIRHVLTLTEETPLPAAWFRGKKITNTFLPIPNYHPPSIEQMDIIMRLFDDQDKLPLLVHCGGGKGRAGTVAACYLAACGFGKPSPSPSPEHPAMTAADAISTLRSLRPGSLETSQQEAFVSTWCSTIWKRQSIYPDLPSEPPPCPLEIEGSLPVEADLFVLVGLPGSGKSWFSNALLARNPDGWSRISQDESGSRSMCETEIGRTPKKSRSVLLDRCNTSAEDRKAWLKLTSNWCINPVCVLFDYDTDLCTSRAQMRAGHSTLPPGGRVRSAVEQMKKMYQRPTLEEGWKAIMTIRSFQAAQEAVLRLSPPLTIFKFPRTPHLIDIGAATDDDVHEDLTNFSRLLAQASTQTSPQSRPRVVIAEKIDGANMGFSLSSSRDRILVQNRSHHINPTTHEQFKKLGGWLAAHEDELRKVLDRDQYFPERYILFGEWMYATHSIAYIQLPDWFMAYDLFDRSTNKFVDRSGLEALLEDTTIRIVPVIFDGREIPSKEVLLEMIQRKSRFYDGRVEGIYVKVEENGFVKVRGKIVRGDFIAGNEHWTRGGVKMNGLRTDVD